MMSKDKKLPTHVAIIMDGNGRWARRRGMPNIVGHRAGVETIRRVIEMCLDMDIKVLTLYAFSTENWSRPKKEVEGLMRLLDRYLDKERRKLQEHNIRFNVIGNLEKFPAAIREKLNDTIALTGKNNKLVLNLALSYGGREEIVHAAKKISQDVKEGRLKLEDLDEQSFSRYLYTKDIPDPDLLIRTSGEMRISNFHLWQLSYAEIYMSKKLWPDFKKEDFKKAIDTYATRDRRFGG